MILIKTKIFKYIQFNYNQVNFVVNLKLALLYYNKRLVLFLYNNHTLILHRKKLKAILLYLINLFNVISHGYYIELLLVGLGYKVTRIADNKICFDLNYSHKIIYIIPSNIIIRCMKKKLVIFGINKAQVMTESIKLRRFRLPNIYKGTGIRYLNQEIKLKIGKQK